MMTSRRKIAVRQCERFADWRISRPIAWISQFGEKAFWLGIAAVACLCCGCGSSDGPERQAVTGRVTLDGAAVENGVIRIVPAEGFNGPTATAVIANGEYEFTKESGPMPGPCRVIIDIDRAETPGGEAPEPTLAEVKQGSAAMPQNGSSNRKPKAKPPKTRWEFSDTISADSDRKDFELNR